jgi:outer membrane receptor for ferrienterochelin and colicins
MKDVRQTRHHLFTTHRSMLRIIGSLAIAATLSSGLAAQQTAGSAEEPDGEDIEEIIVTTTRRPTRIADTANRIEVIDQEELEEKVAMSPGDVVMLLSETSGLRVQMTAPGLGSANVRIQGLRGQYSQVLADGLPLYGGQTGSIGLLQIPPLDLGQVEVLKGVASALYGASALGGVINFISRQPDGVRELLLNRTDQGGTDAGLWWANEPTTESWSYSILATAHTQDGQDVDDDGWTDIPEFRRTVLRPRFHWVGENGGQMLVTAGAMVEDRTGGTIGGGRVPPGDPLAQPFVEGLDTERFDAGLTGRWPLPGERAFAVRASATDRDLDQTFGNTTEPSAFTTSLVEASVDGTSGKHGWIVGLALQSDRYRNDALPAFNFDYDTAGLFAQDELQLGEAVTLSGSLRVDRHSDYGTFFSPRIATLWRPVGGASPWGVRVSAGTGFFSPIPVTEETEATGLSRVVPLAGLRAERGKGVSVDVNRLWLLDSGSIETNLTLFGSHLSHAVSLVQVNSTPPLFAFENADAASRNFGSEFLVRWRSGPFGITVTRSFLNSTEFPPDVAARRTVPLNPRHSGSFLFSWEQEEIWRVGVEGYYSGTQSLDENPYATTSPSYWIFGVLAQRRIGPFSLIFNVENLSDRRLTETHPLLLPQRAPDGSWTTDAWGPIDGRVYNVAMRWAFGGAKD